MAKLKKSQQNFVRLAKFNSKSQQSSILWGTCMKDKKKKKNALFNYGKAIICSITIYKYSHECYTFSRDPRWYLP